MFMEFVILEQKCDELDDMVASSLVPLLEVCDNLNFLETMCADSIAAIELGYGKLFMAREENRSLASAYVFLPYPCLNGCYHLNYIATYKMYSKQGIGRQLMNVIIKRYDGHTITLAAFDSSRNFFEKLGFKFREKNSENLNEMYLGQRENNVYLKLLLPVQEQEYYRNRAKNAFARIGVTRD